MRARVVAASGLAAGAVVAGFGRRGASPRRRGPSPARSGPRPAVVSAATIGFGPAARALLSRRISRAAATGRRGPPRDPDARRDARRAPAAGRPARRSAAGVRATAASRCSASAGVSEQAAATPPQRCRWARPPGRRGRGRPRRLASFTTFPSGGSPAHGRRSARSGRDRVDRRTEATQTAADGSACAWRSGRAERPLRPPATVASGTTGAGSAPTAPPSVAVADRSAGRCRRGVHRGRLVRRGSAPCAAAVRFGRPQTLGPARRASSISRRARRARAAPWSPGAPRTAARRSSDPYDRSRRGPGARRGAVRPDAA